MEFNGLEIVGGVILLGVTVGRLLGLLRVPSVAGYVILGVLLGESFSGVIFHVALDRLHVISELALGAIAFTIGIELEWRTLRQIGHGISDHRRVVAVRRSSACLGVGSHCRRYSARCYGDGHS